MKKSSGFSLVELMIVVMVIGIIAAVAVPEYKQYLIHAKMAEAHQGIGTLEKNRSPIF